MFNTATTIAAWRRRIQIQIRIQEGTALPTKNTGKERVKVQSYYMMILSG